VLTALLPPRQTTTLRAIEGVGYLLVLLVLLNASVVSWLVEPVMRFFLHFVR
jgi:hypothetical protein